MELVTRWDLDKTYLRSRFDTMSELISSAFERAEEKRSIPGATELLRELGSAGARVHILSGSPRQLRRKIEAKLRLDGVRWDELTLKPNLSNLVLLRFGALRDQLGYKLPELLAARARDQDVLTPDAGEILVGDDSESDAFVYSLYADLCAGAVEAGELDRVFSTGRAYARAREVCREALAGIRRAPLVRRILIHLDGQTPPSHFAAYGPRLVPFYNYLQAALVLLETGSLDAGAVLRVAAEFGGKYGFSADAVARSYFDLSRRGHVNGSAPALLATALSGANPAPASPDDLARAIEQMRAAPAPAKPLAMAERIDYVELAVRYRGGRNRRRPGQRF